jgi:GNAT superfamily N-acetyltransferase
VLEVVALAVSSDEQGQGHGTRLVNALKGLALMQTEAVVEQAGGVTTRTGGNAGSYLLTQADNSDGALRFWARQRLQGGLEAEAAVAAAQSCGRNGRAASVYDNVVPMLCAIEMESLFVRPRYARTDAAVHAAVGLPPLL